MQLRHVEGRTPPPRLHRAALAICAARHAGGPGVDATAYPPNGFAHTLLRILRAPVPLGAGELASLALRHTTEVESDDAAGGSVDVLDLPDGERPVQYRSRAVRRAVGCTDVRASVSHDGGETTVKWRAPEAKDSRPRTPKRPGWRRALRAILRRDAPPVDVDDKVKRKEKEKPLTVAIKASQYGVSQAKYSVELACRGIRTEVQRRSKCAFSAMLKGKLAATEIKGKTIVDARKGKCPLKVDINLKRHGRRLELNGAVDGSWHVQIMPKKGVEFAVNDEKEVSMEVGEWRAAWMNGPSLQLPVGDGSLSVDRRVVRYRRYGARGGVALQLGREVCIDAQCTLRDDGALRRRILMRLSTADGIAVRVGHFY